MANKNKEMLKTFFGVMFNNKKSIDLIIPSSYVKDVYSINYKKLYKQGFRGIIFDIDNTLLPVNDINVPTELEELIRKIKRVGFNICIVSNNSLQRVLPPAQKLGVLYIAKADKPNKVAFDTALEELHEKKESVIMVGDQMLSDIKGANVYGIYNILVDPVDNKYDFKTGISRCLQKIMIKKVSKKGIFADQKYY